MAGIASADFTIQYEDENEDLRGLDRQMFGGTPAEVPERYIKASPITYVEQVDAPILIIQGRNDTRCPPRQVEEYERRMRELGKPIEVDWFDAGHLSGDTELLIALLARVMGFAIDTRRFEVLTGASAHRVVELAPDRGRVPVQRVATDHARRVPGFRPAVARAAVRDPPRSRRGARPGRGDPAPRRCGARCRIAMASSMSGAMVAPPPHGARTTNPPSDPSARSRHRVVSGPANAVSTPLSILPGRAPIQRRDGRKIVVAVRADSRIRCADEAGRVQDPVGRLHLEADLLVQPPAGIGRDQQQGPGARPPRRHRSSPASTPCRGHAVARPRPPRSSRSRPTSVHRRDPGADHGPVEVGDERRASRDRPPRR